MTDTVREQILAIRDTGLTNMFDVPTVQRLAYDRGYYELVCYLEEHRSEYAHFILTGEAYSHTARSLHRGRVFISVRDAAEDRRPLSRAKTAKSKGRLSMRERNAVETADYARI